jgi:arylsulfatase A-like enzyme
VGNSTESGLFALGRTRATISRVTRRGARLLVCSLLPFAAAACSPSPAPSPLAGRDLILVNVDALRADHLGCYGYARDTSPFLDSLCREGVVFERASAGSSYTRESVAALFTGLLPSKSGAIGWNAAPPPARATLAERLRRHGYRTGFLSNTVMLQNPGFTRGFETVRHLPRRWSLSGEGPRLSAAALDFVRKTAPERFFLYLHYLDPHAPYEPAPRFTRRFSASESPDPLSLYEDVAPRLAQLRAEGFGPGDPRFEDLVTRYDAEIAATDEALQQLFRGLAELGVLDHTLVVITADHGEEFLEHDFVEHGWTLYEEVLRVPLVFFSPGVLRPARVASRASHVDLVPTLLTLLGVSDDGSEFDGSPLFEADSEHVIPATSERARIAELLIPRRQILRSVLQGDWKYVATWRQLDPSKRATVRERPRDREPDLWGAPVREELFYLGADPGERRNRLAAHPGVRRRLFEVLARFRDTGPNYGFAPGTVPGAGGDLELPPEDVERLEALGYRE